MSLDEWIKPVNKETIKRYKLWIERLKTVGIRDSENEFKMLPPEHPLTRRKIRELEIEIAYEEGRINREEYWMLKEEVEKATISLS